MINNKNSDKTNGIGLFSRINKKTVSKPLDNVVNEIDPIASVKQEQANTVNEIDTSPNIQDNVQLKPRPSYEAYGFNSQQELDNYRNSNLAPLQDNGPQGKIQLDQDNLVFSRGSASDELARAAFSGGNNVKVPGVNQMEQIYKFFKNKAFAPNSYDLKNVSNGIQQFNQFLLNLNPQIAIEFIQDKEFNSPQSFDVMRDLGRAGYTSMSRLKNGYGYVRLGYNKIFINSAGIDDFINSDSAKKYMTLDNYEKQVGQTHVLPLELNRETFAQSVGIHESGHVTHARVNTYKLMSILDPNIRRDAFQFLSEYYNAGLVRDDIDNAYSFMQILETNHGDKLNEADYNAFMERLKTQYKSYQYTMTDSLSDLEDILDVDHVSDLGEGIDYSMLDMGSRVYAALSYKFTDKQLADNISKYALLNLDYYSTADYKSDISVPLFSDGRIKKYTELVAELFSLTNVIPYEKLTPTRKQIVDIFVQTVSKFMADINISQDELSRYSLKDNNIRY